MFRVGLYGSLLALSAAGALSGVALADDATKHAKQDVNRAKNFIETARLAAIRAQRELQRIEAARAERHAALHEDYARSQDYREALTHRLRKKTAQQKRAVANARKLQQRMADVRARLAKLKKKSGRVGPLMKQIALLDGQYDTLDDRVRTQRDEIAALKEALARTKSQRDKTIASLKERSQWLDRRGDLRSSQLRKALGRLQFLGTRIKALDVEKTRREEAFASLKQQFEKQTDRTLRYRSRLSQISVKLENERGLRKKLKKRLIASQDRAAQLANQVTTSKEEAARVFKQRAMFVAMHRTETEKVQSLEADLKRWRKLANYRADKLGEANDRYAALQGRSTKLQANLKHMRRAADYRGEKIGELSDRHAALKANYKRIRGIADHRANKLGQANDRFAAMQLQFAKLKTSSSVCLGNLEKERIARFSLGDKLAQCKINDVADKCQKQMEQVASKGTIRFSSGSATLSRASFRTLNEVAKVAQQCPKVGIVVEGHTDSSGNAASNRELSSRRAEAVAAYLRQRGVPGGRLSSVGHGPDKPVATNNTAAGRSQNRRIEFSVRRDGASG